MYDSDNKLVSFFKDMCPPSKNAQGINCPF